VWLKVDSQPLVAENGYPRWAITPADNIRASSKMNNCTNLDRHALDVIRGKLWWSKNDVAQVFNVSRKTVFNWMQRRLIPYVRIGRTIRFDPAEVKAAILKRRCGSLYDDVASSSPEASAQ
jgi:excisionase family DNA binding protein